MTTNEAGDRTAVPGEARQRLGAPLAAAARPGAPPAATSPLSSPALTDHSTVINVDLPALGQVARPRAAPHRGRDHRCRRAHARRGGADRVHVLGQLAGAPPHRPGARRPRPGASIPVRQPRAHQARLYRRPPGHAMGLGPRGRRECGRRRPLDRLGVPVSGRPAGGTALLAPLKARPWSTSPEEAIGARKGFAQSRDFWRTVLWALMLDVPARSGPHRLPGHPGPGRGGLGRLRPDGALPAAHPRGPTSTRS